MLGLNINKGRGLKVLSGMPQMDTTLYGWDVPLTLEKVYQNINEGDFTYTTKKISFKGVWQPLKDEALELKPEGQRSWTWIWIHAVAGSLNLETADKVIFNKKKYKIMQKKDYSLNGFIEYHLVEDYEDVEEEINNNE